MGDKEILLAQRKKSDFMFTHSPMLNKIHLIQIETNPFLRDAMHLDLTPVLLKDLKFRVEMDRNLDLVIGGETGSGKSRLAQSIAWELYEWGREFINPNLELTIGNIAFTRTEWLQAAQKMQRGDTLIFDEDDQARIGTGSMRQIEEQEQIERTLRQSQFNFIFCSPIIEEHVEHYILRALDIEFSQELNRAVVYKKDEQGLLLPYGHVVLPRHEVEGYEEKKASFRENVQNRTLRDRFIEYDKVAQILIDKLKINTLKKRTQKSLVARYFPRYVDEEVKEIMVSIELLSEKVDLDYSKF